MPLNLSKAAYLVIKADKRKDKYIDNASTRIYNVITMKASLVPIGNSKGIRIPKILLEESGIDKDVEIKASKGMLKIIPIKLPPKKRTNETMALSEKALRRDWDRPEEDKAWANL